MPQHWTTSAGRSILLRAFVSQKKAGNMSKKIPAVKPKNKEEISSLFVIRKNLGDVLIQNTVNLVNGIFLAVSLLLLVFGEVHESLFLGGVIFLNLTIGIIQDLRAKVALEKLRILLAPKIIRIKKDGGEEEIRLDQVVKNDTLKISLGDQIPADGEVVESGNLEVNEALITGESNYIRKKGGDSVLAGSVVMAGYASMRVENRPRDSYVSVMTEKLKKYDPNPSPIQKTLNSFVKYMSYVLLMIVIYVIGHGLTVNELFVSMIKDIGALTGTLVPQGLILSTTMLFAYGALKLSKERVLMQEINASEKLGRIKNLCIDKTGTLTISRPVMEEIVLYGDNDHYAVEQIAMGYINANNDGSGIAKAIQEKINSPFNGTVIDAVPFSSERKYGGATLRIGEKFLKVVMGAPDILMDTVQDDNERRWLSEQVNYYASKAKRLLLLAEDASRPSEQSSGIVVLRPLALFVLSDRLRRGTEKIIDFFQKKGVRIRVISGDNPQTVKAVAEQAGIQYTDMVITGPEMDFWDDVQYEERVPAFHLFARIKPAQKEKIVKLLKKSGFTAMIGDGANDALAIKKADLGIAMFDGAQATRKIAQVVLVDNSFVALPKGVHIAEAIITNVELIASIFFNKVVMGLVLFLIMAFLGYSYPLSPSNTTIINYFTVWLPMVYWTMFLSVGEEMGEKISFKKKILPFSLINGMIMAGAAALVFMLVPGVLKNSDSNSLIVVTLVALGYWFFVLAALNYDTIPNEKQASLLAILGLAVMAVMAAAIYATPASKFFDLQVPTLIQMAITAGIIFVAGFMQYLVASRWFKHKLS
jgi:cation-transporting ATPase E